MAASLPVGRDRNRRLVDDLLTIADAENQARPHYGGTMITVLESPGVVKVHRVVDGQQRLTTVSMLLGLHRGNAGQRWQVRRANRHRYQARPTHQSE